MDATSSAPAAAGPALLSLEGVRAGYEAGDVLHGVDLDVPAGQLLCVLGPSGGGKSSLLRVIAGLEPLRGGRILLDGRDLGRVAAHDRGIGLMFQDYALFPHRDVAANVAFGLRMQGLDGASTAMRVAELLDLVGLPGAGGRSVTALSGGEQQRVALARALAPRPRLLMLDEPMGSLDRSLRERLPEELRDLFVRLGLTVVYVTHDQDEALNVADRVVVLHDGRIAADGAPEVLWRSPPSAWVARFLGARNVARGRLVGRRVVTPWGELTTDAGTGPDVGEEVTVVVRPSSLLPTAGGPIRGRVTRRRFRGDHVLLVVAVEDRPTALDGPAPKDGPTPHDGLSPETATPATLAAGTPDDIPDLHVEARGDDLPAVGDHVELDAAPRSVHVIRGRRALLSDS